MLTRFHSTRRLIFMLRFHRKSVFVSRLDNVYCSPYCVWIRRDQQNRALIRFGLSKFFLEDSSWHVYTRQITYTKRRKLYRAHSPLADRWPLTFEFLILIDYLLAVLERRKSWSPQDVTPIWGINSFINSSFKANNLFILFIFWSRKNIKAQYFVIYLIKMLKCKCNSILKHTKINNLTKYV